MNCKPSRDENIPDPPTNMNTWKTKALCLALAISWTGGLLVAAERAHAASTPAAGLAGRFPAPRVPDGLGVNIHDFSGLTTKDLDLIREG